MSDPVVQERANDSLDVIELSVAWVEAELLERF